MNPEGLIDSGRILLLRLNILQINLNLNIRIKCNLVTSGEKEIFERLTIRNLSLFILEPCD